MSNPLHFWQERNDAIDQRIRTFERKFFIVKNPVKKVEPDTEPASPPDGIIYERVKTRLTITEAFRRIEKVELDKGMTGDEVRQNLYPSKRG